MFVNYFPSYVIIFAPVLQLPNVRAQSGFLSSVHNVVEVMLMLLPSIFKPPACHSNVCPDAPRCCFLHCCLVHNPSLLASALDRALGYACPAVAGKKVGQWLVPLQ